MKSLSVAAKWKVAAALLSASLLAASAGFAVPANAYTEIGKGYVTAEHSYSYRIGIKSQHWLSYRLNDGCCLPSLGKWARAYTYSHADAHGQPIADYSAYWASYSD
ncbi:hypothetical protein [Pseudoscardovia suis]|uniref:Uncharacterized protein n=1 Tax=Pseudoscardovia suis TaxID=987063 RepID=A0A261F4I4_9BIFI|nr:hypothetical protein [Pseudoscardovia suis]OZG54022.1 hypothetical protein PSSU_0125 [Pseudoscardovia suis]PJJ65739.1 hypothetical protein CLV65_1301 [Pseudoscardovia suis]